MRPLTEKDKNEYRFIPLVGGGRNRKSSFVLECSKMNVGDSLFLSKEEWDSYGYNKAQTPNGLLSSAVNQGRPGQIGFANGMRFDLMKDGAGRGWAITRTK